MTVRELGWPAIAALLLALATVIIAVTSSNLAFAFYHWWWVPALGAAVDLLGEHHGEPGALGGAHLGERRHGGPQILDEGGVAGGERLLVVERFGDLHHAPQRQQALGGDGRRAKPLGEALRHGSHLGERVLVHHHAPAGLLAHEGPFTPDALTQTFENLPPLALGLGATAGFSSGNHQYSSSVWGTSIQPDGSFKNLYFWSEGNSIQFFE